MPTVIVTGGGGGTSQGSQSWFEKLMPVAVIAVAAFIIYQLWKGQGTGSTDGQTSLNSGLGGGGGGQQQQDQQNKQQAAPQQQQQDQQQPGQATLRQVINTPGTYYDPATKTVGQGTGLGGLFVEAGPSTPTNFFPLGNVVSTSRQLSQGEQEQTLRNLANSGIKDAWWVGPAPVQKTAKGETLTTGYTSQATPTGRAHCVCTAALKAQGVCGPNDDWYYC
jgi:hypothetical protein